MAVSNEGQTALAAAPYCKLRSRCAIIAQHTLGGHITEKTVGIGERIALGRESADLTQAQLAEAIGVGRTVLAKIENGSRRVSASELFAIADVLDRPIDWFVVESPPAVVSRREDPSMAGHTRQMDLELDRLARDVSFLVREGVLPHRTRSDWPVPTSYESAEKLAREARTAMGVSSGPLNDLQQAVENLDLLAFSLDLGEEGGDAAYVDADGWGVALVNGALDPGRRRFNLAHELGHHLVGDPYSTDMDIGGDEDVEKFISAFAIHLLVPRDEVTQDWNDFSEEDPRLAAVAIAFRYRVSWTGVRHQLFNLGLIDASDRASFEFRPPTISDSLELGERWVEELNPPSVPTEYARRIIKAYKSAKLTAERAAELLKGTLSEDQLPEPGRIPLDAFRREFEPLQ